MKNALATIAFRIVGVVADYMLELASARDQPLRSRWVYIGFAVYASTVLERLTLGLRTR